MVAQADQMLAETRSSIASKEAEIEQLKKSIEIRRAEKEAAEAPEKEALDKYAEVKNRSNFVCESFSLTQGFVLRLSAPNSIELTVPFRPLQYFYMCLCFELCCKVSSYYSI